MPRDVYLQPNASDPVLSEDVILSLVRRYVPNAKQVTHVDESGGEARAYAIDDDIIFKTQRPHRLRSRTSLSKEIFFLNHLDKHTNANVPRVIGYVHEGLIEGTVMTRIPGAVVVNTELAGEPRRSSLFTLGATLRQIHGVQQQPLVDSGLFSGDRTWDDVKTRFEEMFADPLHRIEQDMSVWNLDITPAQVVDKALQGLPRTDHRVALHSNPGPTHTLVDPVSGQFSGLIDFGDAYISHPALDLRQWRSPVDREALLAGYASDKPLDEGFMQTWKIVMILADLMAIAGRRDLNAHQDMVCLLECL